MDLQAQSQAPIKPSQAVRDAAGRVNLDELTERDLDYGADEHGLANLRRRLSHTVYRVNGRVPLHHAVAVQPLWRVA